MNIYTRQPLNTSYTLITLVAIPVAYRILARNSESPEATARQLRSELGSGMNQLSS